MLTLSKRTADATKLLSSLERDSKLQQVLSQHVTSQVLEQAVQYVTATYRCSEAEAEEAIEHRIRAIQHLVSARLTNRHAQAGGQIVIPPTRDNPVGRTVPVAKVQPAAPPPTESKLLIDATPDETAADKAKTVTAPLKDSGETRQQQLVTSIKALKVAVADVAQKMFQVELLEDGVGECITKNIDIISAACSKQTATSVKTMISPLIGQ